MKPVTFHLGPTSEHVRQTAQRHIGKIIREQLNQSVREDAV